MRFLVLICLCFCWVNPLFASPDPRLKETVVVVDKKTNTLLLTNYNEGKLEVVKSFHTTLGKKVGDKLLEGDLKTPEGIYDFTRRATLSPMFGPLAIYISYPNPMDKSGYKTGFSIYLHGTDNPARLEKDFDSKGCVVLDNNNVQEVSDNIKLHETPIIITRDFSELEHTPRLEKAKAFFARWLSAWESKDLSTYVESYADEFNYNKMNRVQFAKYKDSLNKKYDTILVGATNVRYYFHEKYDLISFEQHYKSTFKNGAVAYHIEGKKQIYLQERNGQYRIIREESLQ